MEHPVAAPTWARRVLSGQAQSDSGKQGGACPLRGSPDTTGIGGSPPLISHRATGEHQIHTVLVPCRYRHATPYRRLPGGRD